MPNSPWKKCTDFLKNEAVLCAAVVLAGVSAFFVPPDSAYLDYIDWDTLALLFGLMAVMKGYQQSGLFVYLGGRLVQKTKTVRGLLLVLVFLPFVCSCVVTNDVALLTFVPFALVVLQMAGQERLAVPLLVMQTIAANLGSALTPMGNPQNLYLYGRAGVPFGTMFLWMLPYAAVTAAVLCAAVFCFRPQRVENVQICAQSASKKQLLLYTAGFALCLAAVFGALPPLAVAAGIAVFLLFFDRRLLLSVDYALLGTFVAFFIFVGNVGRIEVFQTALRRLLQDHTALAAVLTSQITSNVPAALLLARFTDNWRALVVGCNLGGLGTLIASMASLISYKQLARRCPEKRGRYLLAFTLANFGLLAVLLALGLLALGLLAEPGGL